MSKPKDTQATPEVETVTVETREGGSITITPEPQQPEADENA